MISDISFNYFTPETLPTETLQEVFTQINQQVTGQQWVSQARADAYYLPNTFFYYNEPVPGAPEDAPHLQLSLQTEEDWFSENKNNIFSGPNGLIGEILGIKAFKKIDIWSIMTATLTRLFPTAVIGYAPGVILETSSQGWIYYNGLPLNLEAWFGQGIIIIRIASLVLPEDTQVTYQELAEAIWGDLINALEYSDDPQT